MGTEQSTLERTEKSPCTASISVLYCLVSGRGAAESRWAPRTSNPLGGMNMSQVGSTPIRSRHYNSFVSTSCLSLSASFRTLILAS